MNDTVQQIVLSYIPTATSTLIEPLWVLVTRLLCTLQPFIELQARPVSARRSLFLTYTAIPPQLVSWKAFCNGHYLIALLGLVSLLANLLTIALSGLFYVPPAPTCERLLLPRKYMPQFPHDPFADDDPAASTRYEPYYMIMPNLSTNTTLPSWQGTKQFFLPAELPVATNGSGLEYTISTTAVGAELECQELARANSNAVYDFAPSSNTTAADLMIHYSQADGRSFSCTFDFPRTDTGNDSSIKLMGTPEGRQAFEFIERLRTAGTDDDSGAVEFCSERLVMAWFRSDTTIDIMPGSFQNGSEVPDIHSTIQDQASRQDQNLTSISLNATFISCRPIVYTAPYNVTVSPVGTVLRELPLAVHVTNSSLTGAFNPITSRVSSLSTQTSVQHLDSPWYHGNSRAQDWTNYLIQSLTSSTGLVDPAQPPPSAETAMALVNEVYARTWAAQLALKMSQLQPDNSTRIPATRCEMKSKIFMSETMFWISTAILVLDIVTATIVYASMPAPFLPRPPTSIASQIAYFAASHCVEDFRGIGADAGGHHATNVEKNIPRELARHKYGFGKFIGVDGWSHTGIERVPFVVPLGARKRRWWPWPKGD